MGFYTPRSSGGGGSSIDLTETNQLLAEMLVELKAIKTAIYFTGGGGGVDPDAPECAVFSSTAAPLITSTGQYIVLSEC